MCCNFTDAESNLLHLKEITQLEDLIHVIILSASSIWYSPEVTDALYKYTV